MDLGAYITGASPSRSAGLAGQRDSQLGKISQLHIHTVMSVTNQKRDLIYGGWLNKNVDPISCSTEEGIFYSGGLLIRD